MNCTHVLGLIDAGPFADYPRAHLNAAWEHASRCATCGPALDAARAIEVDLATVALPAPPPDLTVTVMARIARIDEIAPASANAARPVRSAPVTTRDWSAWATALGGVGTAVAIALWSPGSSAATTGGGWTLRGLDASLASIPSALPVVLTLAAGVLLYAVGLFAPVSARSSADSGR